MATSISEQRKYYERNDVKFQIIENNVRSDCITVNVVYGDCIRVTLVNDPKGCFCCITAVVPDNPCN